MRFHRTNGTHVDLPVRGNMMGYAITGVTFDSKDVHEMLRLTDVQMYEFLLHLSTRFAPPDTTPSDGFPDDYEV